MMKLSNVKIRVKLWLLSLGGLLALSCIAGLALWALNNSNAAAEKAQHYAHKMDLAEKMDAGQAEIALLVLNIGTSRQVARDTERWKTLTQEYTDALEYLKKSATTDEDRGLMSKIEASFTPWQDGNRQAIEAAQQGKALQGGKHEECLTGLNSAQAAVAAYLKYRERRLAIFQQEQQATVANVKMWLMILTGIEFVLTLAFSRIITNSITGPLTGILDVVGTVSRGDVTRDVAPEYLVRKDDIGTLANAVSEMSKNLRDVIGNITQGIAVLSSSSTELSASSGQMSNSSRGASDKAHTVAAAAEEMSANVASVAAGMEQTTTNLASVAAATEQMPATLGEIAGNSERARRITGDATRQVGVIEQQMSRLDAAVQQIGKVSDAITEISSQTNLLALNATIEAARAGSAGKGFAVVANEVKSLAQQANAATEDIKTKVAEVQASATGGMAEIAKVSQVIRDVSEIVASIAAAIEEQSAATRGIAQNVAEASSGMREANRHVAEASTVTRTIARDIVDVDRATGEIASGSVHVKTSATEMSSVAESLQVTAGKFRV